MEGTCGDAGKTPNGARSLLSGMALLHAAPLLVQLVRHAGIASPADRWLGALCLVLQVASLGIASLAAGRRLAKPGDLVESLLVAVTIFLAVPATALPLLGIVERIRPLWVLGACGAIALAIHAAVALRPRPPSAPAEPAPPLARVEIALLAALALGAALMLKSTILEATRDNDSVWYHLPMAAEYVRSGSIRPIPAVGQTALGYPGAHEALIAWLTLPLRSENLALLFPLELAAAALALFALGRSFGLARPVSLAVVALFALSPAIARAAVEQKCDLFVALAFLLTIHFLRRASRSGEGRHALLAGLAGGLLVGAKFSGPIYLALLLAIGAAADLLAREDLAPPRRRLALAAAALAVAAATGGVWYLRNLVLLGDPFYPKEIVLLGHTLFPGPVGSARYVGVTVGLHPRKLLEFRDQFVAGLGPGVALSAAVPLLLPLAALRGHARARGGAWLWLGVLPGLLVILYMLLPYGLQPRGDEYWYVQPRFLLAFSAVSAIGAGALVPAEGRARDLGVAVLAALATAALALWTPYFWIVVALAAAAAFVPVARLGEAFHRRRPRLSTPAAGLAVALGLALATAGALRLDAFREARKDDPDAGYRADPDEAWGEICMYVRRHIAGARILYGGSNMGFPLYGPGLTNTLVVFDPKQDPLAAIDANQIDYIVAFSSERGRHGKRGEIFVYGPSPTIELRAKYPERFTLELAAGHGEVIRVRRAPPTAPAPPR